MAISSTPAVAPTPIPAAAPVLRDELLGLGAEGGVDVDVADGGVTVAGSDDVAAVEVCGPFVSLSFVLSFLFFSFLHFAIVSTRDTSLHGKAKRGQVGRY